MITDPALCRSILDFWFAADTRPHWFDKDEGFDAAIRDRFAAAHDGAIAGAYDDWLSSANAAVALVILLDQFPRNMYRGTARMFAADTKALQVAVAAIGKGFDRAVPDERRIFFYLPFEHAEDLAAQQRGLELIETRQADDEAAIWARKHLVIIERFGRFPHRNAALGRATTAEEAEFLKGPDSSF